MSAWPQIALGELCEVTAGGTPSRAIASNFGGDIPWVKIGDMLQGRVITTEERLSRSGLESCAAKILPAGTVLVSIFATIGRTAILGIDAATNQAIAGITPRNGNVLLPEYLRRFLDSYASSLERRARGVAQANINSSLLKAVPVPLPPLPEQLRIAEILDKADALRAKRRAALALLDTLTQSIFLDMFGDPATNPKGWPTELMEDVAEIVSGATPRTDKAEFWDGTIKWVTPKELSNLQGIYIVETERHITEAGLQSCAAAVLPAGAVLLSSRAPIGHTAICAAPMATNQGFKSLIPRPDRLDAHYLLQWLRLRRSFLEGLGTGATFKEVSKTVVARIQIPVPPLALQAGFADRMRRIQGLAAEGRKARALLDEQVAVLQHRAFRGEL